MKNGAMKVMQMASTVLLACFTEAGVIVRAYLNSKGLNFDYFFEMFWIRLKIRLNRLSSRGNTAVLEYKYEG